MRLGSFARRGFGYATQFVALIATAAVLQNGCGGSDGDTPDEGERDSGGANSGGRSSKGGDGPDDPDSGPSDGGASAGGRSGSGGSDDGGSTSAGGTDPGGSSSSGGEESSGGSESSGGRVGGTGGSGQLCNQKLEDPNEYPACTTCTGGHCVPKDFLTSSNNLDTCSGGGVCLPDPIIEAQGHYAPKKCTSVLGNEGRCSSLCLPAARLLQNILPQDVCTTDERCAPCFNPNDGKSTGVCDFGCDPGPTSDPILFTKCCGGRGECVPRSAIPGNAANNLAPETCKDDNVCVPTKIVDDPTYRFPACEASLFLPPFPPVEVGAGVCVPQCIVDATEFGNFMTQGTCADTGDKCVPCIDPRTNEPSGACL